jgi:hypothetical protein
VRAGRSFVCAARDRHICIPSSPCLPFLSFCFRSRCLDAPCSPSPPPTPSCCPLPRHLPRPRCDNCSTGGGHVHVHLPSRRFWLALRCQHLKPESCRISSHMRVSISGRALEAGLELGGLRLWGGILGCVICECGWAALQSASVHCSGNNMRLQNVSEFSVLKCLYAKCAV